MYDFLRIVTIIILLYLVYNVCNNVVTGVNKVPHIAHFLLSIVIILFIIIYNFNIYIMIGSTILMIISLTNIIGEKHDKQSKWTRYWWFN